MTKWLRLDKNLNITLRPVPKNVTEEQKEKAARELAFFLYSQTPADVVEKLFKILEIDPGSQYYALMDKNYNAVMFGDGF